MNSPIHTKIGKLPYLRREREHLPHLLNPGERLLDLDNASIGFRGPGIVAVTDRRVLFVMHRRFLRRFKVWSLEYQHVIDVEERSWAGNTELRVQSDSNVVYLPIVGSSSRARELRTRIARLAGLE